MLRKNGRNLQGKSLTQSEKSPTSKLRCRWGYVKLYSVGVQAPTELKRSAGCARIRIGSESAIHISNSLELYETVCTH